MSEIFLDTYTNKILTKIYGNQNLCKLLAIDDNNSPTSYPDIANTKLLYNDQTNKRIYTTQFNIDIINQQKTTLTVNVVDANLDRGNVFYKDIKIEFFVLCPYNLWELVAEQGVSALRPNAIIHELQELFVSQRTIGLGKDLFGRLGKLQPSQVVGGYRLEISAKDFVGNM